MPCFSFYVQPPPELCGVRERIVRANVSDLITVVVSWDVTAAAASGSHVGEANAQLPLVNLNIPGNGHG